MKLSWKKLAIFAVLLIAVLFLLDARVNATASSNTQDKTNFIVSEPVTPALSIAVRDLPAQDESTRLNREINPLKWMGDGIGVEGLSSGLDALAADGVNSGDTPSPLFTFEAQGNFNQYTPPDTDGDVGPNHYIQMVNVSFAIYDKSGNLLSGPTPFNDLFNGAGGNCEADNSGDPIVLYDELADRWILTQFAVNSGQDMCYAVSQTGDPLGSYYLYEFGPLPDFPDYPKIGVWPDAYYMGTNSGFPNAYYAYAFDRVKMLAGQPATYQAFGGYPNFMMPADVDGTTPPPAGTPGKFYTMLDAGYPNHPAGVDRITFYEFDVDWTTPGNTTFTLDQEYPIAAYNYTVCGFFVQNCIPQPGTGQTIDSLSYWPMFRLAYRNLGSYEAMVGNFTVDLDNTNKAAIRWFEMRDEGAGWNLYQEGTYAPNSDHRWMGSIAMDGSGNIALGYSVSSTTTAPSIRYATRLRTDPLGTLQAEATGLASTGVQTGVVRWGDYSAMSVDPADSCTFWYTTEYHETSDTGFSWNTRVIVFKLPECTGALGPDFTLTVTPDTQAVCAPDDAVFNVTVGQVQGYTDPVTLSAIGNPAGTTAVFSTNPVVPPGTSDLTIGNTGSATAGNYSIDVVGVAATSTHTSTVTLDLYTAAPGAPTLTSPANGATDVPLAPTFQWDAVAQAASYYIEIATDSGFTNIVDSATVATNSYTPGIALSSSTIYYWRVTASNACGDSATSSTFSFVTLALLCRTPNLGIVDNTTVSDTFVVGNNGTLLDLNVSINASHTWVGDTTFELTHQDTGTSVTMIDRPGYSGTGFGCSNNNIDVVLDDEGVDGPVENQCATDPALFGNPTPNNPLSAFDGEDLAGTWIISVTDSAGGDTGTLAEWCLEPAVDNPTNGSLSGTVTDDDTGDPIVGATVTAVGPETDTTTTDGSGFYTLSLVAGDYDVTASATDFITETMTAVTVITGVNTIQNFALVPLIPEIMVSPDSYDLTYGVDTVVTESLTISNVGNDPLDWTIEEDALPTVLYSTVTLPSAPVGTVTFGDGPFTFSPLGTGKGETVQHTLNAPEGLTTITHSATQNITALNSVSCNAGGLHTDNSYLRHFTLADFGITDSFDVTEVSFGVEQATGATGD
ncbi:MAG: carboxypeptidase regulatory-like domain-containing protein, partial [Anaerolineales bacterium]|nr:carboxypeptidase regulatory-like domain-containing protein [Anaerolineales bacterium]